MDEKDQKLVDVLVEIQEHLYRLNDIPMQWKHDLAKKLHKLIEVMEKNAK